MARTRKSTGSALATGAEAQVLAARLMSMHADAGLTIAMRMPLLMKGAFGDSRGQREATKAVTEKVGKLDRKALADIAIHDPAAFGAIAEQAKRALAA